jgi:hypothetical protein
MSRPKKKLNEPERCHQWPRCVCNRMWAHWDKALDDLGPEPEELRCAQVMINVMLACVECRCPDWRFRQAASVQLLSPVWAADLQCDGSEGH